MDGTLDVVFRNRSLFLHGRRNLDSIILEHLIYQIYTIIPMLPGMASIAASGGRGHKISTRLIVIDYMNRRVKFTILNHYF